jgi:hypothetical protein
MRRGEYHPQVFIQMNMSATSLKPPVSIIIIIGYIYIYSQPCSIGYIIGYVYYYHWIYIYIASHVRLAISLDISIIIIIGYIPLVSLLSLDIYPVCRLSQPCCHQPTLKDSSRSQSSHLRRFDLQMPLQQIQRAHFEPDDSGSESGSQLFPVPSLWIDHDISWIVASYNMIVDMAISLLFLSSLYP